MVQEKPGAFEEDDEEEEWKWSHMIVKEIIKLTQRSNSKQSTIKLFDMK